MDSTQPAPLVTHPYLYVEQLALVIKDVAAKLQDLLAQGLPEVTTQPIIQVSLHEPSKSY